MNIKLWDDKYAIKSDPYCYRVVELKQKTDEAKKKTKKKAAEEEVLDENEYEFTIGYVNDIAHCFKLIVEKEGRANKCTSLNGYIKHLEEINKKLEENLNKFAVIVGGKEMVERAVHKAAGDE